ncbi:MAG: sigma-70 family RNA polymerase sigma factor [Chloroflexi bacterium]|nr:sigma-70 family RNA polymerase sigma factor [Chloroflexota bacterium]
MAAARHDQKAFRVLFRRYHPRVFAYVAARVGSADDADDIAADVFVRVVDGLPGFEYRGPGSFSAWVFRIAYHEVVQHVRRYRLRDVPIDDLPEIAGGDTGPEHALQRKERFAAVRRAILRLPPRQQEVVSMRYFAGVRNREIAEALGIDERTVASTIIRALENLRLTLRPELASWVEDRVD